MQSLKRIVLAASIAVLGPGAASAFDDMPKYLTPSFKDADLVVIARSVGEMSGRKMIVDPQVRGQITHTWNSPITAAELYEWFVSHMRERGFTVVEDGSVTHILP